jgi:hypothetical protein
MIVAWPGSSLGLDRRLALIMDPDGNGSELVGTARATAVEIKPRGRLLSGEPGEPALI